MGEVGSDVGGLTREFFRLVKHDIGSYIESTGCFKHDSIAFQVSISICYRMYFYLCVIYKENVHLRLGILFGMAIAQGGGSLPVLSHSVFKFVCGVDPADLSPKVSEIANADTRTILEQVRYC